MSHSSFLLCITEHAEKFVFKNRQDICPILLEPWEEAASDRFPMLPGMMLSIEMASLGARQSGGPKQPVWFSVTLRTAEVP